MKINNSLFKRCYADVRWGYAQIGFFIGLGNFLILVYNFTDAKNYIDFGIFIPIISVIFLLVFLFVGTYFRKNQMAIDHDLGFERDPSTARIFRIILENLTPNIEIKNQIEYLKKIEEQRF